MMVMVVLCLAPSEKKKPDCPAWVVSCYINVGSVLRCGHEGKRMQALKCQEYCLVLRFAILWWRLQAIGSSNYIPDTRRLEKCSAVDQHYVRGKPGTHFLSL